MLTFIFLYAYIFRLIDASDFIEGALTGSSHQTENFDRKR